MFLALKELKHAKRKFALIITVILLVSYLVYFMTALAYGLASSYTNAVTKWDSDALVMTIDANDNLMMSFMTQDQFNKIEVVGTKAELGLFPAVIKNPSKIDEDTRLNVYLFGIREDSIIKPQDSEVVLNDNLVIVSEELKKQGYILGDQIVLTGSDIVLEIGGFTDKATYQTLSVIYMNLATWQKIRFSTNNPPDLFSGIIIKGEVNSLQSELAKYSIDEYIFTLPGYTAQVLTFSIMIIFLIIIVAFVLGIFIYVLTIQKTSMFGVMKAQGISNAYIAGSVIVQTIVLVLIGIIVGYVLTEVSTYFLKDLVPLASNYLFYLIITVAFILFALLGGLFSVKAVLKIDPLRAIGG